MATCDVGLYGLAVMGQNFALNMASHGFKVAVCNRSPDKVDATVTRAVAEGNLPLVGYKDVSYLCLKLLLLTLNHTVYKRGSHYWRHAFRIF